MRAAPATAVLQAALPAVMPRRLQAGPYVLLTCSLLSVHLFQQIKTPRLGVPYYVKPGFERSHPRGGEDRVRLERQVEEAYLEVVYNRCRQETYEKVGETAAAPLRCALPLRQASVSSMLRLAQAPFPFHSA